MNVKISYPNGEMIVYLKTIVIDQETVCPGIKSIPITRIRKIFKLIVRWCDFETIEQVKEYLNRSQRCSKEFNKLLKNGGD